ncbi:MAG: putative extracellular ribonuclease LE [Streblomastix strix]|uniref:Putative extracellular ribonuclease LE n=1 Tax=Streblomastix strix TaxID=222440 RepID=A0A5J4W4V2_9EUKA|nr:MAG: putative extracellular ribonuclease LE [Streblomastix strix]
MQLIQTNGTVGDYNYLVLAGIYLGSACLADQSKSGVGPVRGTKNITVHGLWPENPDRTYPECCVLDYPFNASELDGIDDLTKYWVSTKGKDNNFYSHEWETHGVCSLDLFPSEKKFFSAVVKMMKRVNLDAILQSAHITPGPQQQSKDAVKQALKKGLGADVALQCEIVNGIRLLSNIYFCVDHTQELPITKCSQDFLQDYEKSCPDSFVMPEVPDQCYRS